MHHPLATSRLTEPNAAAPQCRSATAPQARNARETKGYDAAALFCYEEKKGKENKHREMREKWKKSHTSPSRRCRDRHRPCSRLRPCLPPRLPRRPCH